VTTCLASSDQATPWRRDSLVRTADTKRKGAPTDRNPLYVVTGAGDLAVEKLREIEKLRKMPVRLAAELRSEPKAVAERLGALRRNVKALPERAQAFARIKLGKAGDSYDELASRGQRIVGRIRRQKARGNGGAGRAHRPAHAGHTGRCPQGRGARHTRREGNRDRAEEDHPHLLSGTEAASTRRCGRGNKITNHNVQSCHIATGAAGCTSVDSGAGPVRGTERT